jgi:peptide/nickel transport system substrate-binding protein
MNLLEHLPHLRRRSLIGALMASAMLPVGGRAEAPRPGGTLTAIVQPEPTVLTSAVNTQFPTGIVAVNLFDGLVRYDEHLAPQPSLAERWEVAEDGRTITFHLRPGVRWHDGQSFTSADVKFSLQEVWQKVHPRGRTTFAAVESVETPDDLTVVLRLRRASLVILSALNSMEAQILPRHLYAGTDIVTNPHNVKPIGTGPFRFKQWRRGEAIELERNPDYWDAGKPYLDRVIFRIIPDAASRSAALETGEAQYAPYSPVSLSDVDRLRQSGDLVIDTKGYAWAAPYLCMEFNLRRPTLGNPLVRQAIAHAIDRQGLIDTVWYGLGKPATGPVPSSVSTYYTADVTGYEFDPKKAEALLDQAGYPRKEGGMRFALTGDFMPYGESYRVSDDYIRQNLRRVGIDMTVRSQDLGAYLRQVYGAYDFDTNVVQMSVFLDPQIGIHRQFWSKSAAPGIPWTNDTGYANPATDAVIEASQRESDPAKRVEEFHALQRLAMTDLPVLPLIELQHFTVYSTRLRGVSGAADAALSSLKDIWFAG